MASRKVRLSESQLVTLIQKAINDHKKIISEATLPPAVMGILDGLNNATSGWGTTVRIIPGLLNQITDLAMLKLVNDNMSFYTEYASLQDMFQGEYGVGNYGDMEEAAKILRNLGADVSFRVNNTNTGVKSSSIRVVVPGSTPTPSPTPTPAPRTTLDLSCASREAGYTSSGDYFVIGAPTYKSGSISAYNDGRDLPNKPGYNILYTANSGAKKYATANCLAPGPGVKGGLTILTDWVS